MSRRITDFDQWYKTAPNNDPWGYDNSGVIDRQDVSLKYIQDRINDTAETTFIEFGAFQGDFTLRLATNYPKATIYANDISEIALDINKEKTSQYKNVHYLLKDMFEIDPSSISIKNGEIVIMLMECLYYLTAEEREAFIKKITTDFPKAKIFISAPIIGKEYFTENSLVKLFTDNNFIKRDCKILNYRKYSRLNRIYNMIGSNSAYIRNKYAHQVIYMFSSTKK